MQQNVIIKCGGRKLKVQFDHCTECVYFERGHKDVGGCKFADADCISGPARKGDS